MSRFSLPPLCPSLEVTNCFISVSMNFSYRTSLCITLSFDSHHIVHRTLLTNNIRSRPSYRKYWGLFVISDSVMHIYPLRSAISDLLYDRISDFVINHLNMEAAMNRMNFQLTKIHKMYRPTITPSTASKSSPPKWTRGYGCLLATNIYCKYFSKYEDLLANSHKWANYVYLNFLLYTRWAKKADWF